jgi:hypothetical protein
VFSVASSGAVASLSITPVDNDLALSAVPAAITTDATSPSGTTVSYSKPVVIDEDSPATASVGCTPAPGSTFAIGTTTVTCTASDSDDVNSTVTASFTVTVLGAAAQLDQLAAAASGVGPGNSLPAKVSNAQADLAAGDINGTLGMLNAFVHEVDAQSAKTIPADQAATLLSAAVQIDHVLGG